MKRLVVITAAASLGVSALVAAAPAGAASQPEAAAAVAWAPCPKDDESLKGLECANLQVPLDYKKPRGQKITVALSRAKHTASKYQGILLVNPGGPGGPGRDLAAFVAGSLPKDVASTYDVIGFDPRGVGASKPAISCNVHYFDPVRQDYVPGSQADEAALRKRAADYATACATKYGSLLPHMTTVDAVHDMDAIRAALGQKKINFFGYSYGTYLGSVYGSLFPNRVRRMVLDSIVRPSGVWYDDNIDQDYAFDRSAKAFFGWTAKYEAAYRLGGTGKVVEKNYYALRAKLKAQPLSGKVGPDELDDTVQVGGYIAAAWPLIAKAWSDYATTGKPDSLVKLYERFGAQSDDNGFAVYNSVQCSDAKWPRDWRKWHNDSTRVYKDAPFLTWGNTWFNAPCATWAVPGGKPVKITGKGLPGVLLFQATKDAATPYPGGVEMHGLLGSSRLVVERGGRTHGITLRGNRCLDNYLSAYLANGKLPASKKGPDAYCAALPDPTPLPVGLRTETGPGTDLQVIGRP